jgi:hypothetical protein
MTKHILILGVAVLLAGIAISQQPKAEPPQKEPVQEKDYRILPLVVVKAGETKEQVMTVSCHLGLTRGGGLFVKLMGDAEKNTKIWKRDGVTVEVPDFGEAVKGSEAAIYAPLKEKNLNAFTIKVTTTLEAKAGLLNFHLADETCSGSCSSDFRVLVVANK